MRWDTDGRDWPNRSASRFIEAAGLRWHVQQFGPPPGEAPVILLLHGTGSSSHSWRDVAPMLGQRYGVLSMDLPGHAFTSAPASPSEQSLPGMARRVVALLDQLQIRPTVIVGHSAGAAVAARMVLDGGVQPSTLVSLNGAFLGFGGVAGAIFSPLARLLASGSLAARFFAWQARDPAVVQKLVRGTGSVLDPTGMRLYARLVQSPAHVSAALAMMAHWDLAPLERELPQLALPVVVVAAENDLTVPAAQAPLVAAKLPQAQLELWPMLGHLAHEESPAQCVQLIAGLMERL
jgi:magnesium chelatase accessory protein